MALISDPNSLGDHVTTKDEGGGVRSLDVNIKSGGSMPTIREDGINVQNTPHQILNFTGSNVDCADAGGSQVNIDIDSVGAGAYASGTYKSINLWGDAVPLGNNEFDTDSMHDSSIDDSGTATGTQTSTTLKDTNKSWDTDEFANYTVRITGGTGIGQFRKIASNTSDTLTVNTAWTTTPSTDSTYEITDSTKIVVPKAGLYLVIAHTSFQTGSGYRGIAILVNGSYKAVTYLDPNASIETTFGLSRILNLAAHDYVEMRNYQSTGSDLTNNSGSLRMYLQVVKQ